MTENLSALLLLCQGRMLAQYGTTGHGARHDFAPEPTYWSSVDFMTAARELDEIWCLAKPLGNSPPGALTRAFAPLAPGRSMVDIAAYLNRTARLGEEAELRCLIEGLTSGIRYFGEANR